MVCCMASEKIVFIRHDISFFSSSLNIPFLILFLFVVKSQLQSAWRVSYTVSDNIGLGPCVSWYKNLACTCGLFGPLSLRQVFVPGPPDSTGWQLDKLRSFVTIPSFAGWQHHKLHSFVTIYTKHCWPLSQYSNHSGFCNFVIYVAKHTFRN